jgi:hypothetical protein
MTVTPQPETPNVAPFCVETHEKKWDWKSEKYEVVPHNWMGAEGLSLEFVIALVCSQAQNEQKTLRCRIFDSEGRVLHQFMASWYGRTRVGFNNDGTMYRLYYGLTSWEAKAYGIKVNLGSCDRYAQ